MLHRASGSETQERVCWGLSPVGSPGQTTTPLRPWVPQSLGSRASCSTPRTPVVSSSFQSGLFPEAALSVPAMSPPLAFIACPQAHPSQLPSASSCESAAHLLCPMWEQERASSVGMPWGKTAKAGLLTRQQLIFNEEEK